MTTLHAQGGALQRHEPRFMAAGVAMLLAARFPAWLVALAVVVVDTRPPDNLRHEPLLVVLAFVQVVVALGYVMRVRPLLRRRIGDRVDPRADLLALSAIDMLLVFAILYASGGFNTPYYHFAVVALLLPSFLLGWIGSLLALSSFVLALVGTWTIAGAGTDLWLRREQFGGSIPGLVLTPLLVVVVSQYLAWSLRRLDDGQRETAKALEQTAALYSVASRVAQPGAAHELARGVVNAVLNSGRFSHASVWLPRGATLEAAASAGRGVDSDSVEVHPARAGDPAGVRRVSPATEYGHESLLGIPLNGVDEASGLLVYAGRDARRAHDDARLLRAVADQLSVGLARLALASEREDLIAQEERARIAREIHDGIAQSIYMLSLHLDRTADELEDDPRLGPRLRRLVALSKEALVEVRHYIFDLKPLLAGDTTLAETIRSQASEFASVAEIPVDVEIEGDEPALPVATCTALYRIVQEALANAFRHGAPTRVGVRLEFLAEAVVLEVSDDGSGFDASALGTAGRGLGNMRDRAEEVGGSFSVASGPGTGAVVRVEVPRAPAIAGVER